MGVELTVYTCTIPDFFSDKALSCDVCPMAIFNGHQLCIVCGQVACRQCDLSKLNCSTGKSHTIYLAVVHSDVHKLEGLLKECETVMRQWDLKAKAAKRASSTTLFTAKQVQEECAGSLVQHNAIQPRLLELANEPVNEQAFSFLIGAMQPFIVACKEAIDAKFWDPKNLAQQFGDLGGTVWRMGTGTRAKMPIKQFFKDMPQRSE